MDTALAAFDFEWKNAFGLIGAGNISVCKKNKNTTTTVMTMQMMFIIILIKH